jgi:N-acetyltransferase 10
MSDAPAHHLFVLLGPVTQVKALPDILCVIQVCFEGEITSTNYIRQTTHGVNPSGDLIPWCVSQQFQNSEFASLSGARVVRVAVHPELQHMGYGSRAVQLLSDYYEGKLTSLDESDDEEDEPAAPSVGPAAPPKKTLLTESVAPRKNLPPLLCQLSDRKPETLHWLGVSFGLTPELYRFWNRRQFHPLYVRQSVNDVTGEHTCVMVKAQSSAAAARLAQSKGIAHAGIAGDVDCKWLTSFNDDFRRRFISLLGFEFRNMPTYLALTVLQKHISMSSADELRFVSDAQDGEEETKVVDSRLTAGELSYVLSPFDMKRLESYASNMIDYHLILDLLPALARLYFSGKTGLQLTTVQGAIILALGLQFKPLANLEHELSIGATQLLALFNKSIRKFAQCLRLVKENAYTSEIYASTSAMTNQAALTLAQSKSDSVALSSNLASELKESGVEVSKAMKEKQRGLLESLSLEKYAISGTDEEWAANAKKLEASIATGKTVAIKATEEKIAAKQAAIAGGDPREKKAAAMKRKSKAASDGQVNKRVRSEMGKKYGKA